MQSDSPSLPEQKHRKHPRLKRVVYTTAWLLAWPVIIGGIALVVLGATNSYYTSDTPNIGVYMGIYFGGILLLCLLFAGILRRIRRLFAKIGARILMLYTWTGIFTIIAIMAGTIETMNQSAANGDSAVTVATTPFVPELRRDGRIDTTLLQIGVTNEELDRFSTAYVDEFSNAVVADQQGRYQSYVNSLNGKFSYGELSIKPGLHPDKERIIIAHEYLHHIWFAKMDEHTKENVTSHLISMYGRDQWMQNRVVGYSNAGTLNASELFAYYCTESTDGWLTQYVLDQCNLHINRSALALRR